MKNTETANRLRIAMNLSGLSQQELSERSGVSKASISQYCNGTYVPSNVSAGKMAKVLSVSPVWLMGFDVPMRDEESRTYYNDPEVAAWAQKTYDDPDMHFLFSMKQKMTPERFKKHLEWMKDTCDLENPKNDDY